MSISSRVTVAGVAIDGHATHSVSIQSQSAGGETNLRMADGSIEKQVAWEKRRITLTCSGWVPPALGAVNWSNQITIIVPDENGTRSFTGYASEPVETRAAGQTIECSWALTLEEG